MNFRENFPEERSRYGNGISDGWAYHVDSCFPHFFGAPSETLVITEKFFNFGCPKNIIHVY